jgi:hypothetical protein
MMTLAKHLGRWSGAAWWLALVGLVACAGTGGDPNLVGCLVDTETEIGDTQALPPGFSISPAEARAGAIGFATGDLERHDGTRIDLTLAIEAAGAMTLQRRSWQTPPGNGRLEPASALDCEDAYALPVTVHAQALPDLDLLESTTLTVTASGRASFHLRVDATAHLGAAAPRSDDVDDHVTAIEMLLDARRDGGAWAGEVGFGIERRHGAAGDPDGAVSYTVSPWGAWVTADLGAAPELGQGP